ncbi:MAG: hypothetical protein LBF49_01430 [Puniceicoccales bacterium]|jgi:hypothetical protein|nr:hypothetical protein [Puniceicoccales bacterium]
MKNRRMKNVILFMVGLLIVFARQSITALPLFNGDGSLTEGSKYLCQALGIDDKVTNAQQFTEFFQTNFRGYGEEVSWEKYASLFKFDEDTFIELFKKLLKACELLGMSQTILPRKEKYDYVIIFGSATEGMEIMCQFIRNEMANIIGNNPDTKIFFIASQRPLDLKSEFIEIKQLKDSNLPQTEIQAAQLIWERELGEYSFSCEFVDGKRSQNIMESLLCSPGAVVVVGINPYIAPIENKVRSALVRGPRWFEFGGTLEGVGYAKDLPYSEFINLLEDQKVNFESREVKLDLQRGMIWIYIDMITNCAMFEFKQLTVEGK